MWLKVVFAVLIIVLLIGMVGFIVIGATLLSKSDGENRQIPLCLLITGLIMLLIYIVVIVIRLTLKKKHRSTELARVDTASPNKASVHKPTGFNIELSQKGLPTRREAEKILSEAETHNVGQWVDHSRNVAMCAEKIARACGMDGDKAYVLGLLHDIGRKFGVRHLGHVYDGYKYMLESGYTQVAKICLTHSFCIQDIKTYIGKFDIHENELQELTGALNSVEYDDYDKLIQLCDAIGAASGVVDIEERMQDVKNRYGFYPQNKWDKNIELKNYFDNLAKRNIYDIVGKQ